MLKINDWTMLYVVFSIINHFTSIVVFNLFSPQQFGYKPSIINLYTFQFINNGK